MIITINLPLYKYYSLLISNVILFPMQFIWQYSTKNPTVEPTLSPSTEAGQPPLGSANATEPMKPPTNAGDTTEEPTAESTVMNDFYSYLLSITSLIFMLSL